MELEHFQWFFLWYLFIPLVEAFSKPNYQNLTINQEINEKNKRLYDYIIFLMVPFHIFFLIFFFNSFSSDLTLVEKIGRIFSMGILSTVAINIGHELGPPF